MSKRTEVRSPGSCRAGRIVSVAPGDKESSIGISVGGSTSGISTGSFHHKFNLTAETILEGTKLPMTTSFLAFFMVGRAKTGISSHALRRHLGVSYRTAWLVHNKIMEAMNEREEIYVLRGKV